MIKCNLSLARQALCLLLGWNILNVSEAATAVCVGGTDLDLRLAEACRSGDLPAVISLVNQGASLTDGVGEFCNTPLLDAIGTSPDIVKFLLNRGAAVNQPDSQGSSPLLHACADNDTEDALLLLRNSANPNQANQFGVVPLMQAAMTGNDAIVKALIRDKANLNSNCQQGPAVYWAAHNNHPSTLKLLIQAGADLHLAPDPSPPPEAPAVNLLGVAAVENLTMIDMLINYGVDISEVSQPQNDSALFVAAADRDPAPIQKLLSLGAEVNYQNARGETALFIASIWNNLKTAKALIDHGADINIQDKDGETALTRAGDRGNVEMVAFLTQHGALKTKLHIIPKETPIQPLSNQQLWALAVCAMYNQADGFSNEILGGHNFKSTDSINLLGKWSIHDHDSFLAAVGNLRTTGDRVDYQSFGLTYSERDDAEFSKFCQDRPDIATLAKSVRESYQKWKSRSGLAWDLCRAAMLVNNGYAAGYIDQKEAWRLLLSIARDIQQNFSSWAEMSLNFLDGRKIWNKGPGSHMEACAALLLNRDDPNSPWNQLNWKTDLGTDP